MTVFGEYAQFYDSLYREKDYPAECDYLEQVFGQSGTQVHSILDLGCGTGGHALELARRGYRVTGVDVSRAMLAQAIEKSISLPESIRPQFIHGDICSIRLDEKVDAVISMFAVMSYMTTNADLEAAFATARSHLNPKGLFFFDAWFGPAVLTQRPTERYKIIEEGEKKIIRFANPVVDVVGQTVTVNYKILDIINNQVVLEVEESHVMRFLFCQELKLLLNKNGFDTIQYQPFLGNDTSITDADWNMSVIAYVVE
jgi:SAM-dependent methyltransferase